MRGFGGMRLSTDPERDDARSLAVLRAALDAGVELLDTADAYALDDADVGHNERLIAAAAPPAGVVIVTKGGLVRPDGIWHPDGRARHLADAARASRERLGRVDLYILHAIDPKTPLATSVRALARLREAGVVGGIGVGNVTLLQLEAALAIAPLDAVEIELSPGKLDALHGGLVAACEARGIRVIAHRPLGGPRGAARITRDPVVGAIAARLGASPVEVALAWLRDLSPVIATIPGATRIETAISAARAVSLDDEARAALAAHWLDTRATTTTPTTGGEVVMLVGMQGAGKSTVAAAYAARGYEVLNRDTRGGSLADLARALEQRLAAGTPRVVVDNTYGTRGTRAPVIRVARRHGRAINCVVLATALEDAQANVAARELEDPARRVPPGALFRYTRTYEAPRADEGFDAIEERAFTRRHPAGQHAGLIVELDDVIWRGRPTAPAAITLLPDARAALDAWRAAGFAIAGTTWQPTGADPLALAARLTELVGPIAIAACPHPAGPPICWCRKPLPGLGLQLARARSLDLARSVHAGTRPADRGFARRLGIPFVAWPAPPP